MSLRVLCFLALFAGVNSFATGSVGVNIGNTGQCCVYKRIGTGGWHCAPYVTAGGACRPREYYESKGSCENQCLTSLSCVNGKCTNPGAIFSSFSIFG